MNELKNVICPKCKAPFRLTWDACTPTGVMIERPPGICDEEEWYPQTIFTDGCPLYGIDEMNIVCPHCSYIEHL